MSHKKLYLEDLNVGDTFSSDTYQVSAEEINTFAEQYDPQVFHLDEQKAKETFFKSLSASGWHTSAITMRLVVDSVPFAHGIIGAGVEVNWPKAVRAGDILKVKATIKEIIHSKSKPNQAVVVVEQHTTNQDDDVVQHTIAKLMSFTKATSFDN